MSSNFGSNYLFIHVKPNPIWILFWESSCFKIKIKKVNLIFTLEFVLEVKIYVFKIKYKS